MHIVVKMIIKINVSTLSLYTFYAYMISSHFFYRCIVFAKYMSNLCKREYNFFNDFFDCLFIRCIWL